MNMKKLISFALCAVLLVSSLLCAPVASAAQNGQDIDSRIPIALDSSVTVPAYSQEEMWFSFTPSQSGAYAFYAEGQCDTVGYIYDSHQNCLDHSDDHTGLNFRTEHYMRAGEEYILRSHTFDHRMSGVYKVTVAKLETATAVSFEVDCFQGQIGLSYDLNVQFHPLDKAVYEEDYTITSSNEDAVIVDANNMVYIVGSGSSVMTVTTELGLTANCTVEAEPAQGISAGEIKEISADHFIQSITYEFIPEEDGVYAFDLSCAGGWHSLEAVIIYGGAEMSETVFYSDNRITVQAELEGGEKYYIPCYIESTGHGISARAKAYKCVTAAGIDVAESVYTCYVGDSVYPDIFFLPENAAYEGYTVLIENESVAVYEFGKIVIVGEGTTSATVRSESGFEKSFTVIGKDYPEIFAGDTETVAAEDGYNYFAGYKFIPKENGIYVFYSDSQDYCYAELYDSDLNLLETSQMKGDETNFHLQYELSAGETYYYMARGEMIHGETYRVKLEKGVPATKVSITEGSEVIGFSGDYYAPTVEFSPENAIIEDYNIVSSKNNVFLVENGVGGYFAKKGSARLTLTCDSGLSTYIDVVSIGDYISGEIGEEIVFGPELATGSACIEFIPQESGSYIFYSSGSTDVYASITDFGYNVLCEDDDSGEELNFSMKYTLNAGEIYYLFTDIYGKNEGYSLMVDRANKPEGIVINGGRDIVLSADQYVGDYYFIELSYRPEDTVDTVISWEIADETVAELFDFYRDGAIICINKEGVTSITVTTESGLTGTVMLKVGDFGIPGDLDGDGNVNAKDMNILKRYLSGTYNDFNVSNAELTGEGVVDARDANVLTRILTGLL